MVFIQQIGVVQKTQTLENMVMRNTHPARLIQPWINHLVVQLLTYNVNIHILGVQISLQQEARHIYYLSRL